MECLTISGYKKSGEAVKKNKKKHETFASANIEANRINLKKSVFIKREAYKCNLCEKYHVGTTFEMLKNKEIKPKHLGIRMVRFKVQGIIDESLLVKTHKMQNLHKIQKQPKNKKVIRTKNSFYWGDGVWSYEIRNKTVKIILPNGTVIEKEFESKVTIGSVKDYIRNTLKS
jgi:hypothetical protein